MEAVSTVGRDFYIVAVTVSARLNSILDEASSISLEAMNAKVLVARAGDNARTFKPITDFMVALANDTIQTVREINRVAIRVANISLQDMRGRSTLRRIQAKLPVIEAARFGQTVLPVLDEIEEEARISDRELRDAVKTLVSLLSEIDQKMRAALVVTGTTRIEAAVSGTDYQTHFLAVAGNLERASSEIRSCVALCQKQLNNGGR